jgi:Zn-dependent protease with chaperone function
VSVGGALVVYAMVVGFAGPAYFRRARWSLRAPRLGAAAIVAAAWTVLLALVLAGVTIAMPAGALLTDLGRLIGDCLVRLRAAYGTPAGAGIVTVGQALTATTAARIVWAAGRVGVRRRTERRRHRLLVRWAGRRIPELPAVVLDSPGAAAYSLAGRQPTVVVTTGVIALLSAPQLAAVVRHERAHLLARHHRWQTAALLAAAALPVVPLLREAPSRVGRLLEMDADERALEHSQPRVLASALVAVASAGAMPALGAPRREAGGPTAAEDDLTAAGADAAARIRRLLRPPDHLPLPRRTLARVAVGALPAAPLALAAAPLLFALR